MSDQPEQDVSDKFTEWTLHFDWYGIFRIRLWASPEIHGDPTVLHAMLHEWCCLRWGRGKENPSMLNAREKDDVRGLKAVAERLRDDLDLEASEIVFVSAGIGAVAYQRWNHAEAE